MCVVYRHSSTLDTIKLHIVVSLIYVYYTVSEAFSEEIFKAFQNVTNNEHSEVAVRNSATAKELPLSSFALQHETYLNNFEKSLVEAIFFALV